MCVNIHIICDLCNFDQRNTLTNNLINFIYIEFWKKKNCQLWMILNVLLVKNRYEFNWQKESEGHYHKNTVNFYLNWMKNPYRSKICTEKYALQNMRFKLDCFFFQLILFIEVHYKLLIELKCEILLVYSETTQMELNVRISRFYMKIANKYMKLEAVDVLKSIYCLEFHH